MKKIFLIASALITLQSFVQTERSAYPVPSMFIGVPSGQRTIKS